MRKILAVLLSLIMMLSLFSLMSCNKEKENDNETSSDITSAADTTSAATSNKADDSTTASNNETTAADISTASDDTTATLTTTAGTDNTTDDTTTANEADNTEKHGFPEEEYFNLYSASGERIPQSIATKGKGIGAAITMPKGHWISSIGVNCPSWSDDYGSLTLYLYKWDTDFKTTVAAEPLYSEVFKDYSDNSMLEVLFDDEQFGDGKYLFLMKEGVDPIFTNEAGDTLGGTGVGVWMGSVLDEDEYDYYKQYEIESYINGRLNTSTILEANVYVGYYS